MTPTAIQVRDAARDILAPIDLFRFVHINPEDIEPDDQLPSLMIWAARETMRADGDTWSGEPHFINELTLVLDIKLRRNKREQLQDALAVREQAVLSALLTSPDWLSLIEGVQSTDTTQTLPREGETWFGRSITELVVQYRSRWEPVAPNDYRRTILTTRPYGHDGNTPAITTVIDQVPPQPDP